jgi:hypothetical protein
MVQLKNDQRLMEVDDPARHQFSIILAVPPVIRGRRGVPPVPDFFSELEEVFWKKTNPLTNYPACQGQELVHTVSFDTQLFLTFPFFRGRRCLQSLSWG